MKSLRIAMLSSVHWRTPPVKQGAAELVASNITEELVKRGHDVTLFATGDSITTAKLRWVAPHALLEPSEDIIDTKMYSRLHEAMVFEASDEFDIIHNQFDGYPLVFSKLIKTPVVTTIHGFSTTQIKDLYKRYDNTYYVSISNANRLHCPEMNWVANIYHGIDFEKLPFGKGDGGYFAHIGRAYPTKGTHLAIQAALKAGVKLKIAAHIDYNDPVVLDYWQNKCLPYIDGQQIMFVGEVDDEGKSELLKGAIATLFPIQWDEPFGLVFVESMASGTPVIVFERGSAPEVIKDGIGGILVEPDNMDNFVEAIHNVANISRQNVRDYAKSAFSIETMVDQYEKVYEDIIAKHKVHSQD